MKIEEVERVLEERSCRLVDFVSVVGVAFHTADDPVRRELLLTLVADGRAVTLEVLCLNVQRWSLRLGNPAALGGFAVDDISAMQWDQVNYKLSDFEEGALEVLCGDVEFRLL